MSINVIVVAMALFLAGCSTVNTRSSLPDVEQLVGERAELPVSWPESPSAAEQVDAQVRDLLSRPLTADSAVRIALINNRGLRAVYEQLGVAEAELVAAGLLGNPVLEAKVRVGVGSASGTGVELGLVEELIGALQIPLRKHIAEAHLETAKLELADAILGLALDTKSTFYGLQGAMELVELRQRVAMAVALAAETAKRQHDAGNITDLELASEQALREEAKLELAAAEAQVLGARHRVRSGCAG